MKSNLSRKDKRKLTRRKLRRKSNKIAHRHYLHSDLYLMKTALLHGVVEQIILDTINKIREEKKLAKEAE